MLTALDLPDVFSPAECDRIVAVAEAAPFGDAGLVRGERLDNIRKARVTWLEETRENEWIADRLTGTVISANRTHFGFDLTEFSERAQIAWYDAGAGGHFDWHVDIGDGPLAQRRKLTLVIQLSEDGDYEGGDLELNASGSPARSNRARGSATLFAAFTPHRVAPVIKGARYSLTTWVHGPDFR